MNKDILKKNLQINALDNDDDDDDGDEWNLLSYKLWLISILLP